MNVPWVSTHAVRTVFAITQSEVTDADAELVSVEMEGRVLVGLSLSQLTKIFEKQYKKHTFDSYKKKFSIGRYRRVQYRNTQLSC